MGFASRRFIVVCLLASLLAVAGCHDAPVTNGKPVIAVSIFPVASLVEQLTGDWAEVVTLLPASASPHDAECTADQMRLVARADLLVVVGAGLDPWAEKGAEAADSQRLTVVRFADLVGLAPSERGAAAIDETSRHVAPNNHLWLDPILAAKFVAAFSAQLEQRYPAHAPAIQSAADKLLADLHQLDRQYAERLAAVPNRELITFHNAFDLIAERYHLKIIVRLTDIELSPGGEVTPDKIREALDAIAKYKIKVLYAEPEFPDQVVERLRDETGVEILKLDPQGNPAVEGYRTYQAMMRSNLQTLVKGQNFK